MTLFQQDAGQEVSAWAGLDAHEAGRQVRRPDLTNSKPKYRKADCLFPFILLRSHSGQQFKAQVFLEEITAAYEAHEREREQRRAERALSPVVQACTADSGNKPIEMEPITSCSTKSSSSAPRTERRSQNRPEQPRVRPSLHRAKRAVGPTLV